MPQNTTKIGAYKKQNLMGRWTRVELLLELYDRAISSIEICDSAVNSKDWETYAKFFVDANKTILTLHSGLKADEDEVAFNVARLLHFVAQCLENKDFKTSIKILQQIRNGFEAVRAEANELEKQGAIPPMEMADVYRTTA